jgi:hypothetical protein
MPILLHSLSQFRLERLDFLPWNRLRHRKIIWFLIKPLIANGAVCGAVCPVNYPAAKDGGASVPISSPL